jgi:single-strand DNA-binding protein
MSNTISFVGTLGRDAEVNTTKSGQSVLSATVACSMGFGDKKQTMWFRVSLFGKRAEGKLSDYLLKGTQVYVSGELTVRDYEKDGVKNYSLEVMANTLDLVGKRDNSQQSAPQQSRQAASKPADDFGDDQIPF